MMYVAIILVIALLTVIYQHASVLEVNTREEKLKFYCGCVASMTNTELTSELDHYRANRKYKPQYVFMADADFFKEILQAEANDRLCLSII